MSIIPAEFVARINEIVTESDRQIVDLLRKLGCEELSDTADFNDYLLAAWSVARTDIRLSEDEFWWLSHREFHALLKRLVWQREQTALRPVKSIPKSTRGANLGRPIGIGKIDGENVKGLRGKTPQKPFARLCGISVDNLQRAEHGLATDKTLGKICKYVNKKGKNISPADLKKPTAKAATT